MIIDDAADIPGEIIKLSGIDSNFFLLHCRVKIVGNKKSTLVQLGLDEAVTLESNAIPICLSSEQSIYTQEGWQEAKLIKSVWRMLLNYIASLRRCIKPI